VNDRPAESLPERLEFWPDYGGALLWTGGVRIDPNELPIPAALAVQAAQWIARYDDTKLPWEPTRDEAWLDEGRRLFEALRDELWTSGIELVAGEDHWRP
jgi:hypothetical protein